MHTLIIFAQSVVPFNHTHAKESYLTHQTPLSTTTNRFPTSKNHLTGLHLGSPTVYGPLTAFPIWTDATVSRLRRYTTTQRSKARVSELESGPAVNRLQVTHESDRPLVMFGGSILEAGWQHRVLLHDTAVAPSDVGVLDVACVEANRWGGSNRDHRTGNRRAPLTVRGAALGIRPEEAGHFAPAHARSSDQDDVWRRVSHYERRFGASPTSSLLDVASQFDAEVATLTERLRLHPAQRGVLIGVGGHPALLEVFDHPRTLAEEWAGILGSVWLDARGTPAIRTPGYRARAFVRRVRRPRMQTLGDAGVGREVAMEDLSLFTGRGLRIGPDLVHATVLNVRHDLVLAA